VNQEGPATAFAFHHVGISVADRDRSVTFWCTVLQVEPLWVRLLDGDYLGAITGYAGIHIKGAMLPLPGGGRLEVLEYLLDDRAVNSEATANVGNVHICLQVDDIEKVADRAIAAGARAVSARAVPVTTGPNVGAMVRYLRDPDGITLELLRPPPPAEV
jgi:catechol 2,3-dioxygenase-like lactoylglutathione lyase family enzyme